VNTFELTEEEHFNSKKLKNFIKYLLYLQIFPKFYKENSKQVFIEHLKKIEKIKILKDLKLVL
jgi:hypothetical protein